ncbi:MAG: EamA family transporter [Aeromicrobium sp.]|jgi:O-acetylserine/cysteine efflux transporter|nr:EamA family transporter [Aeromicrobium sp.]
MSLRHSMLAVLVMLIWGANFVVIDKGLDDVPPFLFLALRFVFVALPLVFFVPRPQADWRAVVAVGAFMSLGQFSLLYLSLNLGMPAGIASLVLQAQVILTIVIATVVLRERPTRRQVVGAVIGTAGLVTVVAAHGASAPLMPMIVMLGAALAWAIGNVISRHAGIASGFSLVVWSALVVPLPALAMSLLVDGGDEVGRALTHLSVSAIASTAFTVICSSLLGYGIWNSLLARYPAGAVMPFVLLVPVVGIITAWLVQGEVPSVLEVLGGTVMLAGVATATIRGRVAPTPVVPPLPSEPDVRALPTR